MGNIKLFEDKKIRSQWNADQETWYLSIIDVIEGLTESNHGVKKGQEFATLTDIIT